MATFEYTARVDPSRMQAGTIEAESSMSAARYLKAQGLGPVSENCPCTLGRLDKAKEWFVTTPAVALLRNGQVESAWEENAPDLDAIIQKIAISQKKQEKMEKSRFFSSTNHLTNSP